MSGAAITPVGARTAIDKSEAVASPVRPQTEPSAFMQMLSTGVDHVNQKLATADRLATSFAVDDSVPLHDVTYAMQEARLSLQFMLQVRTRLVDAYQQFANMQF